MVSALWTEVGAASWVWLRLLASNAAFAALLFVAVLGLCRLVRSDRPALRQALWLLVLVRLVLPPQLGHPLAIGSLAAEALSLVRLAPDLLTAAPELDVGQATAMSVGDHASSTPAAATVPSWAPLLAAIWLAGFLATAVVLARRRAEFHRLLRRSPPVRDAAVLAMAEQWRQRLGIRRRVTLRTGTELVSPFTTGVIRPAVFIPARVLTQPDLQLVESVVAHEMTHVSHLDGLWLWLQHALQAVYFFNPVVWLSATRLEHERERLADATVLDHLRFPARAYATSIVRIIELGLKGAEAPALSPRARRIHMRIRSILDHHRARRGTIFAEAAVVVAIGLFLLPMARSAADPGPAEPTPAAAAAEQPARGAGERVAPDSRLANPLPGARISLPWGMARDPFNHKVRLHKAVDLAAPAGTPILAAADGVVTHAESGHDGQESWGLTVVIDHGEGLETFYAHLGEILVAVGDEVKRGDTIAKVGSTGRSTGPHLHFAVFDNGTAEDPAGRVTDL